MFDKLKFMDMQIILWLNAVESGILLTTKLLVIFQLDQLISIVAGPPYQLSFYV